MERSFKQEVEKLKLGDGETFHGEAILAVTKALLQSGVAYVGGYQGAPVSHVMDVLNDARDILDDLGVHVETNANEAGAAAMLGASINYPMRGAVAFKSTVGTNVASDALSNLASAGVRGGTLLVLGEDYGEGASIIQERTHAFAMKSQMWLLDPRPNLPKIVEMVEQGFELSEASSTPVMLELRIRACHVQGSFRTKKNQEPRISKKRLLENPDFDYGRICLPPAPYAQEKHKIEVRWPAAVQFIRENRLNEFIPGERTDVGILCQGGMYNAVVRALQMLGLADVFGASRVPIYCLSTSYPLVADEILAFARGKQAILIVEEGQPAYIEDAVQAALRRSAHFADLDDVKVSGKDVLPMAGEYTGEVVLSGLARFFDSNRVVDEIGGLKKKASELLGVLPQRPPGFCVGCPQRPGVSAMKVLEKDTGAFNKNDGILVIMKNGYSPATGTQELPSSPQHSETHAPDMSMERALAGIGADWVRTVDNYRVGEVAKTLKEAMSTDHKGLKVIIAEGECQLERQRKLRPVNAKKLSSGERVVRVRYGVDEDTCTGDHSCIRLSGCPTLTVKDNPDPLRRDPVATVIDGCVGCGLCGENAHAAVLCPSFYRAEVIQNPTWWDKLVARFRGTPVH